MFAGEIVAAWRCRGTTGFYGTLTSPRHTTPLTGSSYESCFGGGVFQRIGYDGLGNVSPPTPFQSWWMAAFRGGGSIPRAVFGRAVPWRRY